MGYPLVDQVLMKTVTLFSTQHRLMGEGDLVIFYMSPQSVFPVYLAKGQVFHNKLGRFLHEYFIGKPFGSKIFSQDGSKHLYALQPTPELWTRVLPHRTQILYFADISLILESLEIRSGSVVIESGTGSGSFSHSIIRAVAPRGHLHTFDFHQKRLEMASAEFQRHGLGHNVTATWRNVCRDGFGLKDVADSVFLDLPAPWDALGHAKETLRKDKVTRICCFSPCIEQVQRTCVALREEGFFEIEMFECLLRDIEVYSPDELIADAALRKRGYESTNSTESSNSPSLYHSGQVWTRPAQEMRGHTSFLTFASLIPKHQ